MARTISMKMKTATSNGSPPPKDKTLVFEPDIRFYEIEDGDNTDSEEESEILIMRDKSLTVTRKQIIKRKSPYINTFYHK